MYGCMIKIQVMIPLMMMMTMMMVMMMVHDDYIMDLSTDGTDSASVQTLNFFFGWLRAPGGDSILYSKSVREPNPEKSSKLFPQGQKLSKC